MSALTIALSLTAACHANAPAPAQSAPRASAAPPPLAANPAADGRRERQFIVHDVKSGQLLLMSSESTGSRPLAAASGALLQPRLSLLWLRNAEQLRVLDLDHLDLEPVTIAEGLPRVDRFSITTPTDSVQTDDGCDLSSVDLDWSGPKIACELEDAPRLRVVNPGWLQAQKQRALRPDSENLDFEAAAHKARLPKKLLACDVDETCGASLPLGKLGIELVLVQQHGGGDCVHVACLLHDPKTGLFATPPHAATWGQAKTTKPGTCGPFLFDSTQTVYLVNDQLCKADSGCTQLAGRALGWLNPGDTVGTPGILSRAR